MTPATHETIDTMISKILDHEGTEFVDRADDAGGPTQCGISLRFAQSIKLDLNGDGVTDVEDIKLVTGDIAAGLFKRYFYFTPHIDTLAPAVQPMLFDEAVNMGAAHAIRCLQEAILCPEIGRVDDATRGALTDALARVGVFTVTNRIVDRYIVAYERIVAHNPKEESNLQGWKNRANSWRL